MSPPSSSSRAEQRREAQGVGGLGAGGPGARWRPELGDKGERAAGNRFPSSPRAGAARGGGSMVAGGGSGGERPRTGERTKKKNRYGHDRWQAGNFEKEIDPLVF